MSADRIEAEANGSIEDRLEGNSTAGPDSRAVYASQIEYRPPTMRSNVAKPLRKSVIAQAPAPEKVSSTVSRKKVQQKVRSVQSFLKSLGLDKYLFTFEAEEVDMAALVCMSDDDLKAMGIPMSPRKKILLELESKHDD